MSLSALADEDLMQLVRRGDTTAFEVVYERHATAAFSLAYRMTGTRNVAEDVVQEAFLSLWRSGARYDRTRGSVRTWVLGIVHNRAIDALRRSMVHDRRGARDEGIEEPRPRARERRAHRGAPRVRRSHRRRGGAPRRGPRGAKRAAHAAARAEPGDRAGVLRRVQPERDRVDARHPDRDREGPHAARAAEDARRAQRAGGGVRMTCEHRDDAGAWVLGALDDADRERFAAHMPGCEICRREVAELQMVADTLPLAAAQVAPPPELKERLMAAVRAEA